MQDQPLLNVHHFLSTSRANGPGMRAVLWLQGCQRQCPGCFNPETHDPLKGTLIPVPEVFQKIEKVESHIEGITVSGGEPLEQLKNLHRLLEMVRIRTNLTILVFSGFHLSEIKETPDGPAFLDCVDVLIAGPFDQNQITTDAPLMASKNQKVHFLSHQYTPQDLAQILPAEILIGNDGKVEITGIAQVHLTSRHEKDNC
jgi:anaerobic ribonucleoside-triphosphate reductase activating protein